MMLKMIFGVLGLSLMLLCTSTHADEAMASNQPIESKVKPTVEKTVIKHTQGFIKDYEAWNNWAYTFCPDGDCSQKQLQLISDKYSILVRTYAGPTAIHQPIVFGSGSMHELDNESIYQIEHAGSLVTVRTQHDNYEFGIKITNTFEYDYKLYDGEWRLDNIYYLDDYDNNKRLPIL